MTTTELKPSSRQYTTPSRVFNKVPSGYSDTLSLVDYYLTHHCLPQRGHDSYNVINSSYLDLGCIFKSEDIYKLLAIGFLFPNKNILCSLGIARNFKI